MRYTNSIYKFKFHFLFKNIIKSKESDFIKYGNHMSLHDLYVNYHYNSNKRITPDLKYEDFKNNLNKGLNLLFIILKKILLIILI